MELLYIKDFDDIKMHGTTVEKSTVLNFGSHIVVLGRPRQRWEDNIKTDLQEVGGGGYGLDRAGSELAHVNRVMNLRVP